MVVWCLSCRRAFDVDFGPRVVAPPPTWRCRECRPSEQTAFDFGSNASRHTMPDGYPALLRRGEP